MIRRVEQFTTALDRHLPYGKIVFIGLALTLIISISAAILTSDVKYLAIAIAGLGTTLALADFKTVWLLMWACVPISTELEFSGGLGMDFPVEILMMLLTGITILWCVHKAGQLSFRLALHPVSLVILMHLAWIFITTVTSSDPVFSIKFLLAKIWYVVPFYVLSYHLLRGEKDIRTWFFWVLVPLLLTIAIVMGRHALLGFSFDSVNTTLKPFYRNHVDYALILGVFLPIVFVMRNRWFSAKWGWAVTVFLLTAIYLTYTRAAYLGVLVAFGGYLIARWKMMRYVLAGAVIIIGLLAATMAKNNRYIDYAPNYAKTITHHKFGNLLEATYKFEDVSTMERFYRWIAAFYMVSDKPIFGFGPNNFFSFYKGYTDQHFVTYVSDNPEHSGVHNYFLMTTVEQGLPGLIIFLALLFVCLLRAEWLYHQLKPGPYRNLLAGVIGSLAFILFALLLNDMIETDKVGSFFFFFLALIVIIERNARKENVFVSPQPGNS